MTLKKFFLSIICLTMILAGCDTGLNGDDNNNGNNNNDNNDNNNPTVTSISIAPDYLTIAKGGNQTFTATVNGQNNPSQSVVWIIIGALSNETTISEGFLTVAPDESASSFTVSATSTEDTTKYGTATVIIDNHISGVTSVTLVPATATFTSGETLSFTATVEGENNPLQTVIWNVEGAYSTETIITNGTLAIGLDESASSLIVRATSTADTSISGTAVLVRGYTADELFIFTLMENGTYEAHFRPNVISGGEFVDIPPVPETYLGKTVTKFSLDYAGNSHPKTLVLPKSIVEFYVTTSYSDLNTIGSYTVDEDNQYLCSENGVLYSRDKSKLIAFPNGSTTTEFAIPETVETIGRGAFYGAGGYYSNILEKIIFPENLKTIEDYAFHNCAKLKTVVWAENNQVREIPSKAFMHCTSLETMTIPEGVETIWDASFVNCTKLKRVYLPSTFVDFAAYFFWGNLSFTHIFYCFDGDGVEYFEVAAGNQHYKSMNGVIYSADGLILEYYPQGKKDARLEIPYGVEIGHLAFGADNIYIEYVSMPNSMTEIPSCIGSFPNLKEVALPETITSIGNNSFHHLSKLEKINFPSVLTSIGDSAFIGTNLSQIHISAAIENIGAGAFSYCLNLTSLTVDSGNPYYTAIDNVLFTKDMKTIICYAAGKTDVVYTIQNTIETIGAHAFEGSKFTTVNIPDSVKTIYDNAFASCHNIVSISLPAVENMGEFIFYNLSEYGAEYENERSCKKLETIYVRGLTEADFAKKTDYYWTGVKNGKTYNWAVNWNYKNGNWGFGNIFFPVAWWGD